MLDAPLPASPPLALLVDRDVDTRQLYREYLTGEQWIVEEVGDGREALAKALSTPPHVVITETRLPGITGYDLCDLLRRDITTRTVPIVVVTGDALPTDVQRAKECGADAVLIKPCLPETLLSEVRTLVARSAELKARTTAIWQQTTRALARSNTVLGERRLVQSRVFKRFDTTMPPLPPPALVCPTCDQPLLYERSHIGGVSLRNPEQWDYFTCPSGCGTFEHRQRTRKVHQIR